MEFGPVVQEMLFKKKANETQSTDTRRTADKDQSHKFTLSLRLR